ncbi:MAG: lysophospholipid acyltransferase family protein [Tepidiformaceae bacterium]
MSKLWWLRLCAPIVGRLPAVFYPVASAIGRAGWHIRPRARGAILRNLLPLCDGDKTRARREGVRAYQNATRYWVDLATLPYRDMTRFDRDHLDIRDAERLAILQTMTPIIVVSAHTGNPELAVQALTNRGRHYVALVEPLRPPAFARELLRLRSSGGGAFYEAGFAGLRAAVGALREGGTLGILGDRDIQQSGVCVTLSGRCVRLPAGPWELARRTGATVLPIFSARVHADRFTLYVEEPLKVARTADAEGDIGEAVERWSRLLETNLRRDPGQWAVLEDFWKVHACGPS